MCFGSRPSIPRAVLYALTLGWVFELAGCSHYGGPALPPEAVAPGRMAEARVVLRDGTLIDLERVAVRTDSIFGRGRVRGSKSTPRPHAIPLSEVTSVQPARFSPTRTLGAVVAAGVVAAMVYLVIFATQADLS